MVVIGFKGKHEKKNLQAEESSLLRFLLPRLLSLDELDSEPLDEDDGSSAARRAASYRLWPMFSSY